MSLENRNTNMPNAAQMTQAAKLLDSILLKTLVRGFYGKIILELNVEDGVIQTTEENVVRKRRKTDLEKF